MNSLGQGIEAVQNQQQTWLGDNPSNSFEKKQPLAVVAKQQLKNIGELGSPEG